jgi:hypothetical protein
MRRLRLSVRALMMAVAVVALLLYSVQYHRNARLEWERTRRLDYHQHMANAATLNASDWRSKAARWDRIADGKPDPTQAAEARGYAAESRVWAARREADAKWYRNAASQAWPPAELTDPRWTAYHTKRRPAYPQPPDPPEPE